MTSPWVVQEVSHSSLPDRRLHKRQEQLLERLSSDPERSVPSANDGWTETHAAYRFFDNARVKTTDILSGHREATIQRAGEQKLVLVVQDTTAIDVGKRYIKRGLDSGTLTSAKADHHHLHTSVVLTPQRVNLGVLSAHMWKRSGEKTAHLRKQRSVHEKESYRWLQGYDEACELQKRCPNTTVISVSDRESDIFALLARAQEKPIEHKAELLIRANANRRVDSEQEDWSHLWQEMGGLKVRAKMKVITPRRSDKASREAKLELRYGEVTFSGNKDRDSWPVHMYAVYAKESNAGKGEPGIEWMLLTTLAVENGEMARAMVAWYGARWEIEVYFRVLKTGCRIDALRLKTASRLYNAIALYLIIGWRLHMITMLSRSAADKACTTLFTKREWTSIYIMKTRKRAPKKAPTLKEVTRMLAQIGGFLARTGDGEPGAQTIWIGYQRLQEYMQAIELHQSISEN